MTSGSTSLSIDDYELGRRLGIGTVGEIFLATERSTGDKFAIKILLETVSSDKLIRSRFRREMTILSRIHHPNIIGYYGGGDRDGRLFFVMEVVDGGTIRELLDRDPQMSWREVASVGRQVASALQLAHNHGIVHRDIKPSNLFLTKEGVVKLGDFGIARDTHQIDLTSQGLTVGTHTYMPPEQINGETHITGSADLYSLGCTLFEMLAGRPPFDGTSTQRIFQQHFAETPLRVDALVPNIPIDLADVIADMLAKKPHERPFNARAVQAVMMQVLERIPSNIPSRTDVIRDEDGQPDDDVPAHAALDMGQVLLAERIDPTLRSNDVSWQRLTLLFAFLILAVALIWGFSSLWN